MLKMIKKIFNSGRTHVNVGRVFYSPYFSKPIVVTAFKSDDNWKFRFIDEKNGLERQGHSLLSFFEEKGYERIDLAVDEFR